jgi:tRNA threonylcarbamoyladenosine biosynthesis protein TsaB
VAIRAPGRAGRPRKLEKGSVVIVLGIDTTTWRGSTALYDEERGLLAAVHLASEESHARRLLPAIEWLLARLSLRLGDLGLLAVAAGPGSFTGLRIGLATAQGLAESAGLPAVGVSTLEATAWKAGAPGSLVCPLLDARRGEVYSALYAVDDRGRPGETRVEPAVTLPEPFLARVASAAGEQKVVFFGDGTLVYRELLERGMGARGRLAPADDLFLGVEVARLGLEALRGGKMSTDAAGLQAIYLRPCDAEAARNVAAGRGDAGPG